MVGYEITPEVFEAATSAIASGVVKGILDHNGELPSVAQIIEADALRGTEVLGLPDHLWAAVVMAQVTLGEETFIGGDNTLPDTSAEKAESLLVTIGALINTAIGLPFLSRRPASTSYLAIQPSAPRGSLRFVMRLRASRKQPFHERNAP